MKNLFKFLLLGLLIISCNNQKNTEDKIMLDLVDKLLASEELQSIKIGEDLAILKNDYCEKQNCLQYFIKHKESIKFYSREEAFMRKIDKYIIINEIDNDKKLIRLDIRNRDSKKLKPLIIQLD